MFLFLVIITLFLISSFHYDLLAVDDIESLHWCCCSDTLQGVVLVVASLAISLYALYSGNTTK